jgi:hypothetical protein
VTTFRNTGTCEYDDLEGYSSLTVFIIGIAVIIVLVFSISIIYYNIYLLKYQTPPFFVPKVFPEFLFPRKASNGQQGQLRTTLDHRLDDVFAPSNRDNF